MPSNFDCLGLQVAGEEDLFALLAQVLPQTAPVGSGRVPGVLRWQDASGVRLILELDDDGAIERLLPSYAGVPGARLAEVEQVSDEMAVADVVAEDGETLTRMAVHLEQRRLLREAAAPATGPASVVALGLDVSAHASPAAFAESDASLLAEPAAGEAGSGAAAEEPLRMATESFISYGLFGDPAETDAYARMAGTVLAVTPQRVALTGGRFTVVRLRTTGMEVDLCLPGHDPGPAVGGVLSGLVLIVGSLPHLEA